MWRDSARLPISCTTQGPILVATAGRSSVGASAGKVACLICNSRADDAADHGKPHRDAKCSLRIRRSVPERARRTMLSVLIRRGD